MQIRLLALMLASLSTFGNANADILSSVSPKDFSVAGDLQQKLTVSALDEAKATLVQGDFRGAREKINEIAKTQKDLPLAELIISDWLVELNYPVMATQILQQVGFTHGKRQDVQLHMAQVAMKQARFYEASLFADAALASEPEPEWSERYRSFLVTQIQETQGAIEERRGRMPEAKAIYTQLLEENPNSPKAHIGLARVTFALGEIDETEKHFRAVEQLLGDQAPVTEVAISTLFAAKNDLKQAEEWLKKGLDREKNIVVRLEYARFLLRQNRPEEAKVVLSQSLPPDALKTEFAFHIAQAEQMLGNFDKSVPILQRLWRDTPNNLVVSNHFAWAMIESEDPTIAGHGYRLAQQNAQNFPNSIEAVATLAWAQFKRGDKAAAEATINRPIPNRNFSRDAAFFYSEILEAVGKVEEAKKIRTSVANAVGEFFFRQKAKSIPITSGGASDAATTPGAEAEQAVTPLVDGEAKTPKAN